MYGEVRGLKAPPRSIVAPGRGDGAGGLERLLPVLDRARACDQPESRLADLPSAHVDHRRIGNELAGDELVRLQDRDDLVDARIALERQGREQLTVADHADHGRSATGRDPRVDAGFLEPHDDVFRLLGRRGRAHDDQKLGRAVCGHSAASVVAVL